VDLSQAQAAGIFMTGEPIIYFVHCVDTEGPLTEETPQITWGIDARPDYYQVPDFSDLSHDHLGEMIWEHRSDTLRSWDDIASMLRAATSKERRMALPDHFGGGWVYNWFCMDHLDFTDNPRGRAMGIHVVFDFYKLLVEEQRLGDGLHWHFHPMTTYREAHRCATSYLNSPQLWEIVGRRILERRWFPSAHRAGFADERPDSHWFLEQWIPFDLSNTAIDHIDFEVNPDLIDGRFGDWRGAPDDWSTYHPDHDYYHRRGNCRRKIARALNLLNRFGNLDEYEMTKAFSRAAAGKPTLVGMVSHDWRNLNVEVAYIQHLIRKVSANFPGVRFKFSEAIEAFNAVHPPRQDLPVKLSCLLDRDGDGRPRRVRINVDQGKVFGPQPFLTVMTRSRRIIHDNLNFSNTLNSFNYSFDLESILPEDVKAVGIAANDDAGNQSIHVVDIDVDPAPPGGEQRF
jgi:hypothetical protein